MGTQTQDPNRQQQGGTDKKSPTQQPKAPHDPKFDPERDQHNRGGQRTDQNQQQDQPGSRKPSSTNDPDSDDDDDSTEQPGKGDTIDQERGGTGRGENR